jgi:F-type H+-transporting ATPase subunit b
MTPTIVLTAAAGTLVAQVVTVIVAFFVVLWVLYALAWRPIINLIDDRRNVIISEFDSIEKRQAQLDSQIKDYEERLRQIDNEARERLNKAVDEGKRMAAEVLEESRRQAEEMKRKAGADITLEIEKARVQLRDEVVHLTIKATEKLLHAELNDEKHRQLVNEFITDLQRREAS